LYEDRGYLKAFREELQRRGWIEGRNLLIEYRFAERKAERLGPLLAELEGLKPDLIVTITTTVTRVAAKLVKTTPVVFTVVADPVESGIVASLARPGGNLTGPSVMAVDIVVKQLELLKEAVPRVSRVAVLWEPTNPGGALVFNRGQNEAPKLGLTLRSLEVRSPADFAPVFAAIANENPDALLTIVSPLTVGHQHEIVQFALKNKLPTMGGDQFAEDGGLMSYLVPLADDFSRAAGYVDQILRGAKPGDLPVQQPTTIELVVNVKTAAALGITIPPSLLLRAARVIR
jgi:putative ABC transport system substrate-binding protein